MTDIPSLSPSSPQTNREIPLCCPRTHTRLTWKQVVATNEFGEQVGQLHGGVLADFLPASSANVDVVWQWPIEFVRQIPDLISQLKNQGKLKEYDIEAVRKYGLIDASNSLTPLGATLAYHLNEYVRQSDPAEFLLSGFLETLNQDSRILDVGCGAGQSLRRLPVAKHRVGVDVDLVALACGAQLVRASEEDIQFVRASGERLPFPDDQFTHVMSRVALNYMHQRRALHELVRVLQPGGHFHFHLEGPGYALHRFVTSKSLKGRVGAVRDLLLGFLLELTGWQLKPGSAWRGSSIYATSGRTTRVMRKQGAQVMEVNDTKTFWGRPFGFRLVGKKE